MLKTKKSLNIFEKPQSLLKFVVIYG